MSTLKVVINQENGTVSVMNDGAGIPVEMHSEEKVYVPELIFGHLLTSSNYNDSEKKVRALLFRSLRFARQRWESTNAPVTRIRSSACRTRLSAAWGAGDGRSQRLRRQARQRLLHGVRGGDVRWPSPEALSSGACVHCARRRRMSTARQRRLPCPHAAAEARWLTAASWASWAIRDGACAQVFNANMTKINTPVITTCKPTDNWTMISFTPDLARFNMTELEEDICSLMRKRVYDAAGVLGKGVKVSTRVGPALPTWHGCMAGSPAADALPAHTREYRRVKTHVTSRMELPAEFPAGTGMSSQARRRLLCLNQVFLNDKRVPIKDFSSYVDLYLKDKPDAVKIHEKINDRWEVCVSASEGQFSQVSFVNGICTLRGGTHVNMIADQLASCVPLTLATLAAWQCPLDARLDMASPTVLLRILPLRRGCHRSKLLEQINKKNKSAGVKPFQIKNQLMVFVNALIENPAFDSQVRAHPQP
jgi:hypothetical protein